MRIYQMGPAMAPPKLSNIGIRVQTVSQSGESPAAAAPAEPSQPVDRLERQTLSRLSGDQPVRLQAFAGQQANSLPVGDLSASRLLNALSRVGNQLDLDSALSLHAAASELVASIRRTNGLDAETPVRLQVEGSFGQIEIDAARLDPAALKATLGEGLAQQPAGELLAAHGQLAGISSRIRAGFPQADPGQIWVSALKTPDFQPARFFHQTLGFNPLEASSSVSHLLAGLPAAPAKSPLTGLATARAVTPPSHRQTQIPHAQRPAEAPPAESAAELALDENLAAGQELASKSEALIAIANELERKLELSPNIEAPDILKLLRSFQKIILQLDADVGQILRKQTQHKQFEHKLLAQFSEQIQSNLRFNKERIDTLQHSGSERLKLLVDQSLLLLRAKVWLAQESGAGQSVQQALSTLQTH